MMKTGVMSLRWRTALAVIAGFVAMPVSGQMGRMELIALPTMTLTTTQFLLGSKDGRAATLAGELRLPTGTARVPAVVLVHGSGGLNVGTDDWAREINGIGAAAFLLDSFTGRGIVNTASDQSQLDDLAMMFDAFRALEMLSKHPRIDASRIAVMGFSKGGVAALYSSNARFQKLHATPGTQFAAHLAFYPPAYVQFLEDDVVSGKPIRVFHGEADNYVPIGPARDYVERLRKGGQDAAMFSYPGAHHVFDNLGFREPTVLPKAATRANCRMTESPVGQVINRATGKSFSLSDTCVQYGPTVGYNAAAHAAATTDVKGFLKAVFKAN